MIRSLLACCLLLVLPLAGSPAAAADFDPVRDLGPSTVRVKVGSRVGTGFVWEQPHHIVTSLHTFLGSDGKAMIQYGAGAPLDARVVRVLKKADLVLLEVTPPPEGLPAWKPLTGASHDKPAFDAVIWSWGFAGGARGASTQKLSKGAAQPPETLEGLLPPGDLKTIRTGGLPDPKLEIYYLNGSLLPGLSGAPIVDAKGRLVGIGDGGLENGASNISWVIPARYLAELTASPVTTLPTDLRGADQLFSAEVGLEELAQAKNPEVAYRPGGEGTDPFVFRLTKQRTLKQLLESAEAPELLTPVLEQFRVMFAEHGLTIDPGGLVFRIYEEQVTGAVIAIPEEMELVVVRENPEADEGAEAGPDAGEAPEEDWEYLTVRWPSDDGRYLITFHIDGFAEGAELYFGPGATPSPDEFLEAVVRQHGQDLNDNEWGVPYTEAPGWEQRLEFEGGRFVRRGLFTAMAEDRMLLDYFTLAADGRHWLVAEVDMDRIDQDLFTNLERAGATECSEVSASWTAAQKEACAELRRMLGVIVSVHLVTFGNATRATPE